MGFFQGVWNVLRPCNVICKLCDFSWWESQVSTCPIFYPRGCHPTECIFPMLVNEEQCLFCLYQGHQVCELHGNLLEKTWLKMSNVSWSSLSLSFWLGGFWEEVQRALEDSGPEEGGLHSVLAGKTWGKPTESKEKRQMAQSSWATLSRCLPFN